VTDSQQCIATLGPVSLGWVDNAFAHWSVTGDAVTRHWTGVFHLE
jgi:hypothetical protein